MNGAEVFWARVSFREFRQHFKRMSDADIVRDIRDSIDAFDDLTTDVDCFGSKCVLSALERHKGRSEINAANARARWKGHGIDIEEEKADPPVDPDFGTNETPQGDIDKPKQRPKDPTHEEVAEYCKELGISDVMRDDFFSYYDMRGWKTNRGVKVAKWKIALKRWGNRDMEGANARFV